MRYPTMTASHAYPSGGHTSHRMSRITKSRAETMPQSVPQNRGGA